MSQMSSPTGGPTVGKEHHRGQGRDRAGAPPRPRKGPGRSTAEAEEGTEQEHRQGQGRDRAGAPPRPRKGPGSTAKAEEPDQGAPPRRRNRTKEEHRQGMEPRNGAARGLEPRNKPQATRKRVKKERNGNQPEVSLLFVVATGTYPA
jgi:hypothetical protein